MAATTRGSSLWGGVTTKGDPSNHHNSFISQQQQQRATTTTTATATATTSNSFLDHRAPALSIPRGGGGGAVPPADGLKGNHHDFLATALGYLVGAGSFGLYTPIAIRLLRQQSADGLVATTWWLKLVSYTCSDIYFWRHGYPLSTYIEALVMTASSAIVLGLVTHFQSQNASNNNHSRTKYWGCWGLYAIATIWGLQMAPDSVVAFGQAVCSNVLNVGSLLPQFALNYRTKSSGDYSPLTASIAMSGSSIRVFTTIKLNGSDPLLMGTFGLSCLLNICLLIQILWYGVVAEGKSVSAVLLGDFVSSSESDERGVGSRRTKG